MTIVHVARWPPGTLRGIWMTTAAIGNLPLKVRVAECAVTT